MTLTFNSVANQKSAIQINACNEVISVAYIEQVIRLLGTGVVTLSTALLCSANHALKRARGSLEAVCGGQLHAD